MSRITTKNDAFGREIWAYLHGGEPYETVEREDGFISAAESVANYFAGFRKWGKRQRTAMRYIRGGRALDVGAGAGRVSLFLQERGLRVTAIDSSPLAIKTCRKRGVKDARVLRFEDVLRLRGNHFDTVVFFGNNFGLFGSYGKAKRLLRQLSSVTSDDAVILAESLHPYKTDNPSHLRYHRLNRRRGRMPCQIRMRIRFHECVGPWFDYLFVSPDEMKGILDGTGWKATRFIEDDSVAYVAVIEKVR